MTSLFGGGENRTTVVQAPAPPAPTPLPPPTMPDPFSPANVAAGRAQAAQSAQRGGRNSTVLTAPGARAPTIAGGSLGGSSPPGAASAAPAYSGTAL